MLKLFPDQEITKASVYNEWRAGNRRVLLGAPTGSGKTVIAASIVLDAIKRGKCVLFIVDMIQLCEQTRELFESLGLNVTVYQGENTIIHYNQQVIVAAIQTLARRRIPICEMIMIDEVHVFHRAHEEILDTYNNLLTLGLSATPMRKGLGLWFDSLVRAPSTKELIEMDRLSQPVCYAPYTPDLSDIGTVADDYHQGQLASFMSNPTITGSIIDEWKRLGGNRQTICFAVNIAHSQAIVRRFNDCGVPALHLDAYSSDDTRKDALQKFRNQEIKILSSVGVLAKGFDEPSASCLIMARPTKSKMLYIQQAGRVLRKYPGKENAIIIDHTGNIERHGLPQRFKIPDLNSTLKKRVTSQTEQEPTVVKCKRCTTVLEVIDEVCPLCGLERTRDNSVIEIDGELRKVVEKITQKEKDEFFRQLVYLCDETNKKRGFAYHLYKAKYNEDPQLNCYRIKNTEAPSEKTRKWFKGQLIRRAKGMQKQHVKGVSNSKAPSSVALNA